MIATITNHLSQGLESREFPGTKFTWFKTNFNMPVPAVFYYTSFDPAWRYDGSASFLTETTSYNVSGFVPGYEICVGTSVWDFENDSGSSYNINTLLYQRWTDPSVSSTLVQGLWGYNFIYNSLPAGYYTTLWNAINIGIAGWEISTSDTYHFRANAVGTPNISVEDTGVTFSNVPTVTQLGSDKEGYIWVEGNDLCYINAGQWKHSMVGIFVSATPGVPKAGYIWIDTSTLHWVGEDGNDYRASWEVKQFASTFTNGATGETFAGIPQYGCLWVDNEFGMTHLAYIADDGYKYLTGAGNDPYA